MKKVHEKKCFIQSLYLPSSIIERRALALLLRPDQLMRLMSVLVLIMEKEMLTRVLASQRTDMLT